MKKFAKRFSLLIALCTLPFSALWAQTQVSGKVQDSHGAPLPGVVVLVQNSSKGTATDADGMYSLSVSSTDKLEFNLLGFKTQVHPVNGRTTIDVVMEDDSESLEELVFVGYGVQKKKLITGASVQVTGDKISKQNTVDAFGALQTLAPGVNIVQSSGQPGEDYKVNIRGLGTTGSSAPLYVIDGVAGGNLADLNPADIESIDVLKDAASAAIYGARAANGVILVTTKQAKTSSHGSTVRVNYDGYYGVQNLNTNNVEPLDAKEYLEILNVALQASGSPEIDYAPLLPGLYSKIMSGEWKGTNWLEESMNRNAPIQNHAVNLMMSNDRSSYSMGFTYFTQEGTLGKPAVPQYQRITARINSTHVLWRHNDRDIIKFGENITFTNRNKSGVSIGGPYSNNIRDLLVACPVMPAYNEKGNPFVLEDMNESGWSFDTSLTNPLARIQDEHGSQMSIGNRIQSNFFLEISPIQGLKIKSNAGYHYNQWARRNYVPAYVWSTSKSNTTDDVSQTQGYNTRWTLENTINYVNNIALHSFDVLVGQSVEKWGYGADLYAKNSNSLFPGSFKHAYISNTQDINSIDTAISGGPMTSGALASFFGRINYNYDEKYLASVVMRADGSSNFARGHRWGYFPSVSAGWVLTREEWAKPIRNVMNFFKLRASWGQNGNADISNFNYLATIAFDNTSKYYFDDKNNGATGAYPDILANPDVSWETSEQIDLGFDARFFNDRLTASFDWYNKQTKDWLVVAPQLLSYGTNPPFINGGDVLNKGVEFAINWSDVRGDFDYSIGLNLAHNQNKITRIANSEGIIHGPETVLAESTGEVYRAQVGYPMGYFWGYATEGVFQNQAQVDAYLASGKATIQENPAPGDLIFIDQDGNGEFNDKDKVMIGNPHPDLTMGLNLAFKYKGVDLSINGYGAFGQQVMKCYRHFSNVPNDNYTKDVFTKYWTAEGSTNKYCKFSHGKNPNFNNISDMYVEDADYFKISNISLGYDFKQLLKRLPMGQCRLYVSAQNMFTFTSYSGMDPEVGYGVSDPWASGIDVGYYPSSRRVLVGLSLTF